MQQKKLIIERVQNPSMRNTRRHNWPTESDDCGGARFGVGFGVGMGASDDAP